MDLTPEQREMVDQIERDLAAWADENVVGIQPASVAVAAALHTLAEVAERWNALDREERIRWFAHVSGRDEALAAEEIADVTFRAEVGQNEHGQPHALWICDARLVRPVEQVYCTVTVR